MRSQAMTLPTRASSGPEPLCMPGETICMSMVVLNREADNGDRAASPDVVLDPRESLLARRLGRR